jgi:hypothetical protein
MAGGPTEGWGVCVIPTICPTNNHGNSQDAQYGVREDTDGKRRVCRREKKVFQPISKFLHVSSGKI